MTALRQILIAFVGSIGFSAVFQTKRKYWLICAIDAALSWMVYLFLIRMVNVFFANLITAAFCSLYAHIASRIVKAPTTCLLMSATVPMIPGGSLYYTIFYAMSGNGEEFGYYLMNTVQVIFAMAVGFALISLIFRSYEFRKPAK